jgi:hypothetical protein
MSKVLEWLKDQGYNFSSMKEELMTESKMILDHCTVCGAKDDEFCDAAGFQDAKCPRITKLEDRQAAVAQARQLSNSLQQRQDKQAAAQQKQDRQCWIHAAARRQQELVPVLEKHEQAMRNFHRLELDTLIRNAMEYLQEARSRLMCPSQDEWNELLTEEPLVQGPQMTATEVMERRAAYADEHGDKVKRPGPREYTAKNWRRKSCPGPMDMDLDDLEPHPEWDDPAD